MITQPAERAATSIAKASEAAVSTRSVSDQAVRYRSGVVNASDVLERAGGADGRKRGPTRVPTAQVISGREILWRTGALSVRYDKPLAPVRQLLLLDEKGRAEPVRAMTLAPDGTVIAVHEDGRAAHWSTTTGRCKSVVPLAGARLVRALAVAADGALVTIPAKKGPVYVVEATRWHGGKGTAVCHYSGQTRELLSLAVSASGLVAVGSADGTLRVWGPTDTEGQEVGKFGLGPYAIVMTPDDVIVATGRISCVTGIFRRSPDGFRSCGAVRQEGSTALAMGVGGTFVTGGKGKLALWGIDGHNPMSTGGPSTDPLRWIETQDATVTSMAVAAGGAIVAGFDDQTVGVWDPATGKRLASLPHAAPIANVAIAPDGAIVTLTTDGAVTVWANT